MTTILSLPALPSRKVRRYRTSYDKSLGATVGMTYSRHDDKARLRIDSIKLARCVRHVLGDDTRARAIVAAYSSLRLISFPRFKDLTQPEIWHAYHTAAKSEGISLTHAITLHPRPGRMMEGILAGKGPSQVFGQFINRQLEPIFRRAGMKLSYMYKIEIHSPTSDIAGRKNVTQGAEDWHVTVLIDIPPAIEPMVFKKLSREASLDVSLLTKHHNGSRVHVAAISPDKRWTAGDDATGRSGLSGKADYVAKDSARLRDTHRSYRALDPRLFRKHCHASKNIRDAARRYHREFAKWFEQTIEEDILSSCLNWAVEADPLRINLTLPLSDAVMTLHRILASDPSLSAIAGLLTSAFPAALREMPWSRFVERLHQVLTEIDAERPALMELGWPRSYETAKALLELKLTRPS